MKLLLHFLFVLICCISGVLLLVYVFQNKLIYPAPHIELNEPTADNIERISFGDAYGYLIRPSIDKTPSPLIIFTHGNGELAEMWVSEFLYLVEKGYSVLLVEYPGYGRAKGKPNYDSIEQTMLSAYDSVITLDDIDKNNIIAYGRSLGGAAAALLAENRPLAALVLESSFSSLAKLVRENGFPSFLLKDRYDNRAIVSNLSIPILIFHGTKDTVIPFSHANTLVNANENAEIIFRNCGHNDCPRFWKGLLEFLNRRVHF